MREGLLEHFADQARVCVEYGSPFTGQLIAALAADIAAGGPTAPLVTDWPGSPRGDALSLRLTGALHAAVLTGRAPDLAAVYPPATPDWSMDEVWPRARAFIADDADWVAQFLRSAPQTNETRRAIALLAGFLDVARSHGAPMDTLEIGASAGLNLHWDRFAYRTASWRWDGRWGGESAVVVDTDWRGPPPAVDADVRVRTRAACDLNPLDVRDPAQRLQLRAYVWPDQPARLARFDAAADLAVAADVTVDRADAAEWLERKLAARAHDAVTVVYHSVFYQYPPATTRRRIADVIAAAGAAGPAPLVWLRLEPEGALGGPRDSPRFLVDTVRWPGGVRHILAETDGHVRSVTTLA
ncbi:MAG: DUF2332 domain-containing protein [Hyphomonadaceae bacterium]|nr:DUF2332 domain-containing protein [Hyphomonadaceae bacterium]